MSLEGDGKKARRKAATEIAVAAALGVGAYGYGVHEGVKTGIDKTLEEVNMHWMSPAAASALHREAGATPSEIDVIDANLKTLMLRELEHLRKTRPKAPTRPT